MVKDDGDVMDIVNLNVRASVRIGIRAYTCSSVFMQVFAMNILLMLNWMMLPTNNCLKRLPH